MSLHRKALELLHDPSSDPSDPSLSEPDFLTQLTTPSNHQLRLFLSLNVLLVFLLIAYFAREDKTVGIAVKQKRRKGRTTVLLVGPLASGKTALFSKLVYGHAQPTHTSMKENEGVVKGKWGAGEFEGDEKDAAASKKDEELPALPLETPLHLVDLPGHPRLRTRALAQNLPSADGVIFTIDATNGLTGKNARDAGEHFHVLLSLLSLLSARQATVPRVLILLTKSDLLTPSSSTSATSSATSSPSSATSSPSSAKSKSPALTIDRAKQSLVRELERRRLAASGASSSTLGGGGGAAPLSAGAKLEGLEAIPAGSSSSSGLKAVLSSLGFGSAASAAPSTLESSTAAQLPSDEGEVLSNEDAFGFEGKVEWEKVEMVAGGGGIEWGIASAKLGGKEGVERVWEFVEEL